LILAIELSKLFFLSLYLFLDEGLVTVESLHQLLIGILQSRDLSLRHLVGFLELVFESRAFLS
jgi:hypothetical protein